MWDGLVLLCIWKCVHVQSQSWFESYVGRTRVRDWFQVVFVIRVCSIKPVFVVLAGWRSVRERAIAAVAAATIGVDIEEAASVERLREATAAVSAAVAAHPEAALPLQSLRVATKRLTVARIRCNDNNNNNNNNNALNR